MHRATLTLAAAAALCAGPATARAQPVSGFYMSGAVGGSFPHSRAVTSSAEPRFAPAPAPVPAAPAPGAAGQGSVGFGFGNGLRLETEGFGSTSRLRLPQGP